jgi:hypothetical protein
MPATIQLTAGKRLDNPSTITRMEPTESYRTLGVHISPSGSNKGAIVVLTEIALQYAQSITMSHLNREDTLTSYVQHLLPKLRFQLPALSLTSADGDKLMTPILKAALPKMHINWNMARSIVHGPVVLGGMALPHLSTIQGVDKLHLLLGHLRLEDETGKLLHIDLSYVQLITGSYKFFLNKSYSDYRWVEWGWITSLWSFISTTNITFLYPSLWTPTIPREHDICLMDYFLSLRLPHATMQILNACRLYLQAVTLSDISSADGKYILPEAKSGTPIPYRVSNLDWPVQGCPLPEDWKTWRFSLANLEEKGWSITPLGNWIAPTHQEWESLQCPQSETVYVTKLLISR